MKVFKTSDDETYAFLVRPNQVFKEMNDLAVLGFRIHGFYKFNGDMYISAEKIHTMKPNRYLFALL